MATEGECTVGWIKRAGGDDGANQLRQPIDADGRDIDVLALGCGGRGNSKQVADQHAPAGSHAAS